MDELLLLFVKLLHILFIIFVVGAPFVNSNYILMLHSIFIPFMISHWICNDNTCCLTVVERNIKKRLDKNYTDNDCFTCQLIEPIYDFKKNYKEYTIMIYVITILLWLMSSSKLYKKYKTGEITKYKQLFEI